MLDENVLHRLIGSPAVMSGQCAQLLALPDSVLLHILPSELGASPGLGGPVSLASVSGEPDVLLTGSMLEDIVSADAPQVRAASATFERVRAMTGNIMDSRTIIERHAERWTA